MDWTNFYSVAAGASATLLGLLFVGMQLHIDTLVTDPSNRWRALARSTFYNYTILFIVSLAMLFPAAQSNIYSGVLLVAVGVGFYRLLVVWLPVWRGVWGGRREKLIELIWWLASPLAAYSALGYFALQTMSLGKTAELQTDIGFCIVGLFALVLRNSWNLLVEVAAEKQKPKGG